MQVGEPGMADLFTLCGTIAINSTVADQTIDATMGKVAQLTGTLQAVEAQGEQTGKSMGASGKFGSAAVWMGNMFTKITNGAIRFGKSFVKTGFGFDAAMESYQNQFEALLGNADKASQLVADLQLLAKVSPLGMEGLANNAVSLLNTGTELAEIVPTLEMLGNLSLGDTEKMNSIVRAYTQILSKGQLMAQEMYQLGDAGVPIREIMTLYGGEKYADGTWYATKMKDPTYKIMAEDMVAAFQLATAEGGKWHDYMFKMMDTWLGQTDRLGEESKETLGAVMNPFFEKAKSEVLPQLSLLLSDFGVWVTENQEVLSKMADAAAKLVTGGFDIMINAFKWMAENGEAVSVALSAIGVAMAVGAIAAHPYAVAIMAVAAGLAALAGGKDFDEMHLGKYSQEDLEVLQKYVDAWNRLNELEAQAQYTTDWRVLNDYADAQSAYNAVSKEVDAIEGLKEAYHSWLTTQGHTADMPYLDVPVKVAEGAEGEIQSELDGMTFDAVVKMYADTSALPSSLYSIASGDFSDVVPHAEGAIFSKPTIFDTRIGRRMVGEAGAEAVAPIDKLQQYVSDAVQSTVGGMQFNVVLDSGVLVGQLAPQMDMRLGTLSSRKGRGN